MQGSQPEVVLASGGAGETGTGGFPSSLKGKSRAGFSGNSSLYRQVPSLHLFTYLWQGL